MQLLFLINSIASTSTVTYKIGFRFFACTLSLKIKMPDIRFTTSNLELTRVLLKIWSVKPNNPLKCIYALRGWLLK
jgi:hypothetical protein